MEAYRTFIEIFRDLGFTVQTLWEIKRGRDLIRLDSFERDGKHRLVMFQIYPGNQGFHHYVEDPTLSLSKAVDNLLEVFS